MPILQGTFYLATGLWPIVHLRSFEAVTGPKVDKWLVKTTGALIAAVGASLLAGAFDRSSARSRLLPILGVSSAVTLAIADVVYVAKGRISPIYLADAIGEIGLAAGWAVESLVMRSSEAEREELL